MRDFKYPELSDSALFLPFGRPGGQPLTLPIGVVVECDWLDDGETWVDPVLLLYRDGRELVLKLMPRAGGPFKILKGVPDVGNQFIPVGGWPESLQQWRDDNQRWPIGRAPASASAMPEMPPGFPVPLDPCIRGREL